MMTAIVCGTTIATYAGSKVFKNVMVKRLTSEPKLVGRLVVKQPCNGLLKETAPPGWNNIGWKLSGVETHSGAECFGFTGGVPVANVFSTDGEMPRALVDYGQVSGYKYRGTFGATPEDALTDVLTKLGFVIWFGIGSSVVELWFDMYYTIEQRRGESYFSPRFWQTRLESLGQGRT